MTGKVRLYSKSGRKIRSLFFHSQDEVRKILNRWRDFYGEKMEGGWIQVAPYVHESKVINMDIKKFINKTKAVINRGMKDIDMEDFVMDQGMKHETYWHRCYCKGEK